MQRKRHTPRISPRMCQIPRSACSFWCIFAGVMTVEAHPLAPSAFIYTVESLLLAKSLSTWLTVRLLEPKP